MKWRDNQEILASTSGDTICLEGKKCAARAILDDSHRSMWEDYCPYPKSDENRDKRDAWRRGWDLTWSAENTDE